MIEYFKELENPNECILKLGQDRRESYQKETNTKVDLEFLKKYEDLFKKLKDVSNLFKCINEEYTTKVLIDKYSSNNGKDVSKYFDILGAFHYVKNEEENNQFEIMLYNVYDFIEYMRASITKLEILKELFPKNINNWNKIIDKTVEALTEINIRSIIKLPEPKKVNLIKLPNAWYITVFGDLYNTTGNAGHKESNLIYDYEKVNEIIFSGYKIKRNFSSIFKRKE